jgi:hypothetical protein
MQPVPILDQRPQRQPVARALRPLGFRGFLEQCRRVQPLRHVPHHRGGGLARFASENAEHAPRGTRHF